MRKATEKQQETFVERAKAYLLEIGAKQLKDSIWFHEFELDSIVGKLNIHLPFAKDHSYTYTVYSRFKDVDKAKGVFRCNPYSGKYNFHVGIKAMDNVIQDLKWHFGPTLKIN